MEINFEANKIKIDETEFEIKRICVEHSTIIVAESWKWYCSNESNKWEEFLEPSDKEKIETAFCEFLLKSEPKTYKTRAGRNDKVYSIDFHSMKRTSIENGVTTTEKIRRRPVWNPRFVLASKEVMSPMPLTTKAAKRY